MAKDVSKDKVVTSDDSTKTVSTGKKVNIDTRKYNPFVFVWRLFWSLFMIGIGVVLLLNNFGVLPWSIWGDMFSLIWRLWPVVIVLWGVHIALGRSWFVKLIVSIAVLVFIALVVAVSLFRTGMQNFQWMGDWLPDGVWSVMHSTKQVEGDWAVSPDDSADGYVYDIKIGAAVFTVNEEDSKNPFTVTGEYNEAYGEPVLDVSMDDDIYNISFDTTDREDGFMGFNGEEYDILLGDLDGNPVEMDLDIGAGRGSLSFDSLRFTSFAGNVGAGDLGLVFSDDASVDEFRLNVDAGSAQVDFDAVIPQSIDVEVNVGEVVMDLTLSTDVRYEVSYDVSVGTLSIFGDDVSGEGVVTVGDGDEVIKVDVEVSVGSMTIK